MKIITRPLRIMRIMLILMRYNIDEIIFGSNRFPLLRCFVYFNPYYWRTNRRIPEGERLRAAIEALGPIFVKAGQIISTRRDLLPDDIAKELAKLQDKVPPFCGKKARAMVQLALNARIEDVFSQFDNEALASASIAQVHAATLLNGDSVVVKVLRPNILRDVKRDIDVLMTLASFAERYWRKTRHFKPRQMVEEIAQTFRDELDLLHEAANASQLRRQFKQSSLVYIPDIHWQYCRSSVIVMERIYGIPIYDLDRLRHAGINMKKLAERAIELFFTQVFQNNFFHADMHPGNIFVSEHHPENPQYILVDFGIAGSLSQQDQRYIAENMLAFFKRDYQKVAELHINCGWLPPDTRIDQFEGAIRSVSEPIFSQPLKDVSFGELLLRLIQVARRFHLNIQPQLVLLQKTLLNVEGLSRTLAPELDLWATVTPHLEKWLKKQIGVGAFFRRVREQLPLWSEQLPQMPSLLYEVLSETKQKQEKERFAQVMAEDANPSTSGWQKAGYFFGGVGLTLATLCVSGYFMAWW